MKRLLKGALVVDPISHLDGVMDILIENGKIRQIGEHLRLPSEDVEVMDCANLVATPGLIDAHVHLREPGYEYKETLETGLEAALRGGFTTVLCMPNTDPPNDDPAITRMLIEKSKLLRKSKLYPIAAITKGRQGEELSEMALLAQAGAVAFSDDGRGVQRAQVMRRALEYSRIVQRPLVQHAQVDDLAQGVIHEGEVSIRLGVPGIPSQSETIMVFRDLELLGLTGGKLHIAHVSAKETVALLRQAKAAGLSVTAEVTPHHLFLTDQVLMEYNTHAKVNPPLRAQEDREALLQGLKDGTIDIIASDHAPHHEDEKKTTLEEAAFGISGLETAVSLVLHHLVLKNELSLADFVRLFSARPAQIFGIPGGTLRVGEPADITLLSLHHSWTVNPENFASKGKNTPFAGQTLRGCIWATLVDGEVRYRFEKKA